ncbi:hypothetical protein HELRODRAFT_175336 [Helobdella robusta]|uniref:Apple domain-containing protein n=1 Tax=Helobdella robusta TaxID=6412 RepID=T1F958_HELRO|nr:hypothetical protein HELRODRAFT_175336 [Helobdella robusta]ESO00843.1 hypothetical protein HELRODRAFT_175336 [Helobdella robusta]
MKTLALYHFTAIIFSLFSITKLTSANINSYRRIQICNGNDDVCYSFTNPIEAHVLKPYEQCKALTWCAWKCSNISVGVCQSFDIRFDIRLKTCVCRLFSSVIKQYAVNPGCSLYFNNDVPKLFKLRFERGSKLIGLYVDGVKILPTNPGEINVPIPMSSRIVALSVQFPSRNSMFICCEWSSFSLLTDTTWRCTSDGLGDEDWFDLRYDDSSWPFALKYAKFNLKNCITAVERGGIGQARTSVNLYCRKKSRPNYVLIKTNSKKLFNNIWQE